MSYGYTVYGIYYVSKYDAYIFLIFYVYVYGCFTLDSLDIYFGYVARGLWNKNKATIVVVHTALICFFV